MSNTGRSFSPSGLNEYFADISKSWLEGMGLASGLAPTALEFFLTERDLMESA